MTDSRTDTSKNRLLHHSEVTAEYGPLFSTTWLEKERRKGTGPRYVKAGRGRTARVFYRREDIEAWIEANLRRSTSDPGIGDAEAAR